MLTDNGVRFTDQPRYRNGATASFRLHVFERVCRANEIKRRLTKPCHPWTDGQAERMVRTLEEATVKSFRYETRADLEAHLLAYVLAYSLGKHLKRLRWRTRFKVDPHHLIPGPYT